MVKKYIWCQYCGAILGENKSFEDPSPKGLFCIGCFAESRQRSEADRINDSQPEMLKVSEQ